MAVCGTQSILPDHLSLHVLTKIDKPYRYDRNADTIQPLATLRTMDAFSCFGDDSDVSDEGYSATDVKIASADREAARRLIDKANSSQKKDRNTDETNPPSAIAFQSSFQDKRLRTEHLPWPNLPPLYLGPIHLKTSLSEGGGRGYVASQDLSPGTCVLIEEPLVGGWSDEQMGKQLGLESIRFLLEQENAQSILDCLLELHPRKEKVDHIIHSLEVGHPINTLDRIQIVDMMNILERDAAYCVQQQCLVTFASKKQILNPDNSLLSTRDINRFLLTLRYNGFESGLYLHFSMFNHDEDPNCIKFRPQDESGSTKSIPNNYSEARTTRYVKKGEALTLHYLENPREVSHASRRKIIWDQHRFDIGGEDAFLKYSNSPRNIYESELVGGKFPESTIAGENNGSDTTVNIEKSLDDLEEMYIEIEQAFKSKIIGGDKSTYFDRGAALELTLGELIVAAQSALDNDHHILLSRCRRMHLDVIEVLLSNCSNILTNKQSVEMISRFLQSAQPLLESQRQRYGNDHPDVARTNHDLAMGIQTMLSYSPKRLLDLKLPEMTTLAQCSKVESLCRSEKNRIEKLYPRDVADIIAKVK